MGNFMGKPINQLTTIYNEKLALKARKAIIQKLWDSPRELPDEVRTFKETFHDALIYLRTKECTLHEKELFCEAVFNSELRILLYEIIEIKKIEIDKAEDVCQEIIINLLKRLLPDEDNKKKKKEMRFSDDDYKSFVFYCLRVIKNYGKNQYKTKIVYSVEEYNT